LARLETLPVCFVHIGKVGGHSISIELLNRFDIADTYNGSPEQFDDVSPTELANKRLIIGHYAYRHTLKLPENRFLFSMVRDPIDRVVSNYWYLRTFPGAPTDTSRDMVRLAKQHDLDSFIKLENLQVRQVVENHQCNFFADDWRSVERSSEHLLDLAISHLEEFDFIGLHESYDESMQLLSGLLGWLPWPSDNRLNVTPERNRVSELSPNTLEHLKKVNSLDIRLYAEIARRFAMKRREVLRSLVRANSLARNAVSEGDHASSPLSVDLFADRSFNGEGWNARSMVSGSYARWIGPSNEATLHIPIDLTHGGEMEIYLHGWIGTSTPLSLVAFANEERLQRKQVNFEDHGPGQQKGALEFTLPPSKRKDVMLRFVTEKPVPLSEHGYPDEHRRTGSMAIGAVRLRSLRKDSRSSSTPGEGNPLETGFRKLVGAMRLGSLHKETPSSPGAVEADPLETGRQKLMGANGRVSWVVEAESLFRKVVETRPDDPAGHYWLGLSICYQGLSPDAVEHLRRAIDLHERARGLQIDEYRQAYERLGEGLMHSDRIEEAQAVLAKAVSLQSTPDVGQRLNSASYMLEGLTRQKTVRASRKMARWPVKTGDYATLGQVIEHATQGLDRGEPLLGLGSKVSTLGSCFALNIAHALQKLGVSVNPLGMGELINSTHSNRALLEWVTDTPSTGIEPTVIDVLKAYFGNTPGEARHRLQESDVVIFTLGVAPGFFDKQTGRFHLANPGNNTLHLLAEKEFRTTSVAENVENIEAIVTLLRKLNPAAKVVFTVSPVPIFATFEYNSAIIADCISKSTLRVAIDAYLKTGVAGVHYWPAFEIVRWLGAYHGPMFGAEDGTTRHVSERVVTAIVEKFVAIHGDESLAARLQVREPA
jgi:GSCFA family/Sulfotransferase family